MTPGRHALRHLVSRCNGGADAGTDAPVSKRGVSRVCNGWQRVVQSKGTSSMLSEIKSTPPPQSQTETRPAGGLRRHEPPRRPSSLPGESGTVEARGSNTALLPRPHPLRVPPPPFLLSAGFPCDTPKLACHRDTARLDSRHFFGIPPRPQSSRAAALTHPFPRPTRHPLGRRMSWAEKGPWPRNCIWYPHRLPLCPRLDLVPGNPGIASAVFSYSNREETP